ncbi:hypothetical protein E2562_012818 [Oryza meyeriana var. granulata]|uniref:Uncharacterized protein n=1 Tax=Oryza meyeriana var. granulata TaxID=110450 RepID=A0A6G1DII5_9ORYZ|nr:hypothetical protein E2562_012818 [Oryza meyeriana var. granulata]
MPTRAAIPSVARFCANLGCRSPACPRQPHLDLGKPQETNLGTPRRAPSRPPATIAWVLPADITTLSSHPTATTCAPLLHQRRCKQGEAGEGNYLGSPRDLALRHHLAAFEPSSPVKPCRPIRFAPSHRHPFDPTTLITPPRRIASSATTSIRHYAESQPTR